MNFYKRGAKVNCLCRLFLVKKDLGQVAALRGLKETTIISHLIEVGKFLTIAHH